jgi:hypothetical protein
MPPPSPPLTPPRWTPEQLEAARLRAIEEFRRLRLEEPLDDYLEVFDRYRVVFKDLLELTADVTQLEAHALTIMTDRASFIGFRYLAGPPISTDDLKTVAEVPRFSRRRLEADGAAMRRLVQVVVTGLDRRRFPWVSEERDPTEQEKANAILASAALVAAQRTATARRNVGKKAQEERVKKALKARGFEPVKARKIKNVVGAPEPGQFCGASRFGSREADVVIGLWDGRVMPLECKVSNSETNSVKRLNNDAAVKAVVWRDEFGVLQVVPAAVLSGAYRLQDLVYAQDRGLTFIWAHDLQPMLAWIEQTRP